MTSPQDNEYPVDNRRFNQQQNPWPEQQYDAGYGPGRRDPIEQRSNTTMGDRPMGVGMQPPRPSTASGMRPQPGMQQRNEFASDFGPRSAGPGPPRSGTGQGNYGPAAPAPLQTDRPPMETKDSDLERWMPDFDSQPPAAQPLQDAIGLPLDAAPEAMKPLVRAATVENPVSGQFAQQVHKARSQPDFRGPQNGVAYSSPADAPMVPRVPPQMQGQYAGQRRDGPQPLATNNVHSFNTGMPGAGSMPNSPRQFHRPGAPLLNRNDTAQSGWSDPGPGGPPVNGAGPRQNGASNQPVPRPVNPDALPAHPAPVRPGLVGGVQPGPAQIRQAQAQRHSIDAMSQEKRLSMPITQEELHRLREAVQANPGDQNQTLFFAKKLVEAARVLSNDGGRADERTAQKNREKFIFEAHKQIKRLVSSNYVDAMFFLADCYGTGQLGLAVDPKEAFGLYQSAAKLGHGASAYRTAVCCEMGLEAGGGTRKDPLKAVQWYKRAAALGDTPAMYKLGMILLKGLLGQQASLGEAMIWLQRAADKADEENPHALHELAQIYEYAPAGGKVIQDQGYALQLYQQAAKFGYRSSQTRLGKAYEYGHLGCQIDNRSSIHWYSKAAAQEDHEAELALSGWYLTGSQGILTASDQEAYLWARKAALAELPKAEFAMGYFSETGIGCPKSLEDAKRWYGRAAGKFIPRLRLFESTLMMIVAHKYPKAQQRLEELIRGGGKNLKNRERMSRGDEKKHEDCVLM
jgi:TPR repeat protein